MSLHMLLIVALFAVASVSGEQSKHIRPNSLTPEELARVVALAGPSDILLNEILPRVSVPRVVGTEAHTEVGKYLQSWFPSGANGTVVHMEVDGDAEGATTVGSDGVLQHSRWEVELDAFTEETPIGPKEFRNVIARWVPPEFDHSAESPHRLAQRRNYVIAAHYDSKRFEDYVFEGATDSAAPIALILDALRVLDNAHMLDARRSSAPARHVPAKGRQLKRREARGEVPFSSVADLPGLTVVFFDGEEAFGEWSDTNSIFGARHLAAQWEARQYLDHVDALILLDLLGGPTPEIYNYNEPTTWLFEHMHAVERRVAAQPSSAPHPSIFQQQPFFDSGLQDDHVPFAVRGVPIFHLIPVPFPKVWHTAADDIAHLDAKAIEHWRRVLPAFLTEILHLELPAES